MRNVILKCIYKGQTPQYPHFNCTSFSLVDKIFIIKKTSESENEHVPSRDRSERRRVRDHGKPICLSAGYPFF